MKKTILTLFAVVVTIAASAQTTTVNQGHLVDHESSYNSVKISQAGQSDMNVKQRGSSSFLEVEQVSSGIATNLIDLAQTGTYNEINIVQFGSSNQIFVNQGNVNDLGENKIDIQQAGSENILILGQTDGGNSSVNFDQNSENSRIEAYQFGSNQIIEVTQQDGRENSIQVTQYGDQNPNELSILQDGGSFNNIFVVISGNFNIFDIEQSGDNNSIVGPIAPHASQVGTGNYASIIQSGSNNRINFSQVGNNTSINFEQSGANNVANVNVNN